MAPRMRIETGNTSEKPAATKPAAASGAPKAKVAPQPEPAAAPAEKPVAPQPAAEPKPAPQAKEVKPSVAPQASVEPDKELEQARRVQAKVATRIVAEEVAHGSSEAEESYAGASVGSGAPSEAKAKGDASEKAGFKPMAAVDGWVSAHFGGHVHAFWGAVIALVVAILTFAIGFFRTAFIIILVVAGIAIGQVFDGDPKIIGIIRDLFRSDRDR